MKLHDLAHCRAGDKGNISTLSLFPYDESDYDRLAKAVTAERVRDKLSAVAVRDVRRYEVPNLSALHFVCVRDGSHSVTVTLDLDAHGKSLSFALLEMDIR